jgi:hypothetical protein
MLDDRSIKQLENEIIAACGTNPEAFSKVKQILGPDDFVGADARRIVSVMYDLDGNGDTVDYVNIAERLDSEDENLKYVLMDTKEFFVTSANIEAQSRKLKEYSDDRKLRRHMAEALDSKDYDNPAGFRQRIVEISKSPEHPIQHNWKCYTLEDAYQERPPQDYLVEGLFPVPSLSIVYGPPGHLKTLFLQDMAICVAAGLPWLPPLPDKVGQSRQTLQSSVMWIDFDNGLQRTHERIGALARARQLKVDTQFVYFAFPTPRLEADKIRCVEDLEKRMKDFETRLLVIDNLKAISGDADENTAEMGNVLGNLRMLSENTGSVIIVIHHQRKSSKGNESRAGDRLRGHSSIEGTIDLALLVEREGEDSPNVKVRSTKTRGADLERFGAYFAYEWKPNSKELLEARFYGISVPGKISDEQVEAAIIETIEKNEPMNQSSLKTKVHEILSEKVGLSRIGRMVDQMDKTEKIKSKPGDHYNEKLYML